MKKKGNNLNLNLKKLKKSYIEIEDNFLLTLIKNCNVGIKSVCRHTNNQVKTTLYGTKVGLIKYFQHFKFMFFVSYIDVIGPIQCPITTIIYCIMKYHNELLNFGELIIIISLLISNHIYS